MTGFIIRDKIKDAPLTKDQIILVLSGSCPFCHISSLNASSIGIGETTWQCSVCDVRFNLT